MPPFQYEGYTNPNAASIEELLLRRGDIEAVRAQQVANAAAAAKVGTANAWAGATSDIGRAGSAAMVAMTDPRRQLEQVQLTEAQRNNRSRNILEAELKNPSNYKADGTLDDDAVTQRLKAQDVGAWEHWTAISAANQKNAIDLREKVSTIAKNQADVQEKNRQFAAAQQEYLGRLAYHGLDLLQQHPDDPLHARDSVLATVARAAADPYSPVSEPDAKAFLARTASASPAQLAQALQAFIPPDLSAKFAAEKASTAKNEAEAAEARAKATNLSTYGTNEPPKPGSPEDWVMRGRRQAIAAKGAPLTDPEQQASDAKALEAYKTANQDPDQRAARLASENLANVLKNLQVGQQPTPEDAKNFADDIINHRLAPDQLSAIRGRSGGSLGVMIERELKKRDPAFNWEEASAEYQLVKSPGFQNTVRLMDSVRESMPRLLETAKALGNSNVKFVNGLVNWAKGEINDPKLKAFATDSLLVGDEVAKILAGGGTGNTTSDSKLKQAGDILGQSDSPRATAAALKEIDALIGFRRTAMTRGTYLERTGPGGGAGGGMQVGSTVTYQGKAYTIKAIVNGQAELEPVGAK